MPRDQQHSSGSPANRKGPRYRPGLTLAEMLVSMGIVSTLVLALGSVLLMATQALPEADLLEDGLFSAHQAAIDIAAELQFAISFSERESNAITFTVADRDGDDDPEEIRYAWSGTSGDPLTRQYNSDSPVEIVTDVNAFTLTYQTRVEEGEPTEANEQSGETLLAGYDTPGTLADYSITDRKWVGQTIEPNLPADATSWSVTRVRFVARSSGGTGGVTSVQLRPLIPLHLLPYNTILAESPMYESALGSVYTWQEFSFTDVDELSPTEDLGLVLASQVKDSCLAEIQYEDAGGAGRLVSTDKGSSWSRDTSRCLLYQVYGTVTTTGSATPTLTYLQGVGLKLDLDTQAVETSVQVLNAPEVETP